MRKRYYFALVIIFVLLLLLILFLQKKKDTIQIVIVDRINDSAFNRRFVKSYINSIQPNILKIKLNNFRYGNRFIDYFRPINIDEYNILNNIVKTLPDNKLLNGKWKIIKTVGHLELNFPFTLGDTICLPEIKKNIRHTLVHERMHILQRLYNDTFNRFLINSLGFRLVVRIGYNPSNIFANPDGFQLKDSSWIFKSQGYWWCPFLLIDDKLILKKIAYKVYWVDNNTVKMTNIFKMVENLLGKKYPTCPLSQLYHPYEIMADMGADFILKGTCGNSKIDSFYKHFKI